MRIPVFRLLVFISVVFFVLLVFRLVYTNVASFSGLLVFV
jgi:hypothetical protein